MIEPLEERLALSVVFSGGPAGYQTAPGVTASLSHPQDQYYTTSEEISLELSGLPGHSALRILAGTPGDWIITPYSANMVITVDDVFAGQTEQTTQGPQAVTFGVVEHDDATATIELDIDVVNMQWFLEEFIVETVTDPLVTVSAFDGAGTESGTPATDIAIARFTRYDLLGNYTQPLGVNYTVTDETTSSTDYDALSGNVTIPAGQTFVDVPIKPKEDELFETTETLHLGVAAGAGYFPSAGTAQFSILDNDFKISSTSVGFNTQGITKDDGSATYQSLGSEWWDANGDVDAEDANERKNPTSHRRSLPSGNNHIVATVIFGIEGTPAGTFRIKGTGSGAGDPVFEGNAAMIGNTISAVLTPSQALPDTIDYDDLEIDWEIERTFAGAVTTIPYGMSRNRIYVTGADAVNAFETVLDIGCRNAKGKRPGNPGEAAGDAAARNQEVVDGIWNDFSNNEVKAAVSGNTLRYNHDADSGFDTAALLLKEKGRCGAWARFFVDVLNAQGVTAAPVQVKPTFRNFPGYTTLDSALRTKSGPAQGSAGAAYGTTDFYDHAIVKVSGITHVNAVYDPSYGRLETGATMAAAELKWEDVSIDSYQFIVRDDATGATGLTPWFANAPADELDFI